MADITLHFCADHQGKTCEVCGADLNRSNRDRWWLRNTWTTERRDYTYGATNMPGEHARPCGSLDRLRGENAP
jgi:hypothetical protein